MNKRVIINDSTVWKDAIGKSGTIKGSPIRTSNSEDLYLVEFDDAVTKQLSSSYGGFTFKMSDFKFI
ncbi:hypothetical protein HUB98_05770 [Paenibacillus barcinonensis]|uniref:Uncharacterized protein n=1 Tax=Paenibacillus barcinonensis TaxID=198119 RepID=A0A2V4W065_PAEBA|nr:hypothetical protein [Paenibacillus barcinonensis]PYE51505.1 hypothetical protein DFQ00_102299 [Paenibacillus barcinonensis]QKS55888.1 hypothetical protein HUB98_05770 [Paenibacillus barcinonensis]